MRSSGFFTKQEPNRDYYTDEHCATLDGKRARIGDFDLRKRKFALIWQIDNPCMQAEFSWPTVDRIMAKDAKFST